MNDITISTSFMTSDQHHHVVLFPFLSKGHTIPLLDFACLLRCRLIAVTIFTTPSNHSFIANTLSTTSDITIIDIPFPQNVAGIPPGTESTDKLPSMSLFPTFAMATKQMQPYFETELEKLPRVSFMVSDGFLWWTLDSAKKFGFPRLSFYGMNAYALCVSRAVLENKLLLGPESDHEPITIPKFPWIRVTKSHFDPLWSEPEPKDRILFDFNMLAIESTMNSHGFVFNTFYDLEPVFVDDYNSNSVQGGPKGWCLGPFCLARPIAPEKPIKPTWVQWLDHQGSSVLYVAFGSQAQVSQDQMNEISMGLEKSEVNFLWVMRKGESELCDGFDSFEERVKERGIVVREWVDQREILQHPSVKGFLSHCGWNSVLESVCAGVPILAWPMMAEQPLNAMMVEEEIKIGFKVETCDGSVRGFVKWEGLDKMIKELIEGERGKEVRKNVNELAKMAKLAMQEPNGSSWKSLDLLIQEICISPNQN